VPEPFRSTLMKIIMERDAKGQLEEKELRILEEMILRKSKERGRGSWETEGMREPRFGKEVTGDNRTVTA